MENVVNYFREEILKVESLIRAFVKTRQWTEDAIRESKNDPVAKSYLTVKCRKYEGEIKRLGSEVVALQRLLEEAVVAQRLLEASKR